MNRRLKAQFFKVIFLDIEQKTKYSNIDKT